MASNGNHNIEVNGSLPHQPQEELYPPGYPTVIQKYTSQRWRLGYMVTLAFLFAQCMLICMSFAVVCMTRGTTLVKSESTNQSVYSVNTTSSTTTNESNIELVSKGEFEYTSETKGLLLSSVFYVGIVSPTIGSFASRKFGPKRVILFSMLTGGSVMLLLPVAARTHVYLAVLCRVLIGLTVNTVAPVSLDFWLYWAPIKEKDQFVAYSYSGFNAASIILFAVSGFLCLIPIDNGWPFIFYVFGSCSIIWCMVWQLIVCDKPENHPYITETEKCYVIATRSNIDEHKKEMKIPFREMARSAGVWAFLVIEFCHAFNASILFNYLPSYMSSVLNFDVEQNGLLSSLPYITRVLGAVVLGYISSKMLNYMSVTKTRKVIQAGGYFVSAGLAVAMCYLKDGQEYIAVGIFTISTPFQVCSLTSGFVTPLDMAPQYAGIITSFGMAFAVTGMMISPIIVSKIVTESTRQQWSYVFYMSAGIYLFAAVFFLLFGSGKLQTWADNTADETNAKKAPRNKEEVNTAYVPDFDEITRL